MFQIPDALVYEPADLGLDSVIVAANGGITNGVVVPWIQRFPWKAVSIIIEDDAGGGATPIDLFQASAGIDGALWQGGLANSSLLAGFTNNPRTQFQYLGPANLGNTASAGTTGTMATGELAKLFASPWIRFGFRNNHATIVATLSLTVIGHFYGGGAMGRR